MKSIIYLSSGTILMAILVISNLVRPIDSYVYELVISLKSDIFTLINKMVTSLGDVKAIFIISFLWLLFLLVKGKKEEAVNFMIIILLSIVLMLALKTLFARPRPNIAQLIKIGGFSFPSGHSMLSMVFYGYFINYMINNLSHPLKYLLITLLGLLIFSIGFSRIYLGVHYFSDVITGFLIGLLILDIAFINKEMFLQFCNIFIKNSNLL